MDNKNDSGTTRDDNNGALPLTEENGEVSGDTVSQPETAPSEDGTADEAREEEKPAANEYEAYLQSINKTVDAGGATKSDFQPVQLGYQPVQPGYQPVQPGYQPAQPGYQPAQPGYQPAQPGYQPVFATELPDGAVTPERRKSSKRGFRIICLVLAVVIAMSAGLTVGYFVGGGESVLHGNTGGEGTSVDLNIQHRSDPEGKSLTLSQIAEAVKPSIVVVCVYSGESTESSYSYSSGVIFSQDGYIVTNDHIFGSIASPVIYVTTYDGKTYSAEFVAGDSRGDIAIIKIDAKGLSTATFGYSSELIVGEEVVAVGNAGGLEFTVTDGIVSALDRRISDSNGYSAKYIQTSAPISSGSSGGALVNSDGQVVGITSAKSAADLSEGLSFAIPADRVIEMIDDLLKNGRITTRGKLGISYNVINVAYSQLHSIPVGLLVQGVSQECSLYGQLEAGDIITAVNGVEITSASVMLDAIEEAAPGDSLALTVYRNSATLSMSAKLIADEGFSNYGHASEDSSLSD